MKNRTATRILPAALMLAMILLPSGVATAALGPSVGALVNGSDTRLVVRLDINAQGAARCQGFVLAKHARATLPSLRVGAGGMAEWRWSVPATAPKGRWAAYITCRSGGTGNTQTPKDECRRPETHW